LRKVFPARRSKENSGTILVVDDEPDVLQLIESILADGGYSVVTAGSAESAIEAFEKMPDCPALLLTDVVMPGMSGPMLVEHLLARQPALKVLFMSGYDDSQVVRRYVVEKGFRLIPKPFTIKSLRMAIKAELDPVDEAELKY
jgi:two-component system cell cycle sensor histidine kinase/response regulator CckA